MYINKDYVILKPNILKGILLRKKMIITVRVSGSLPLIFTNRVDVPQSPFSFDNNNILTLFYIKHHNIYFFLTFL